MDMAQFFNNLHQFSVTGQNPFNLAYSYKPLAPSKVAKRNTGSGCLAEHNFAFEQQEIMEKSNELFRWGSFVTGFVVPALGMD